MKPHSGNQRPDLLTSLMNMSFVLCCHGKVSLQILFKCPTPAIVFWKCHSPLTFCSLLTRCTIPCACHAKRHLNVQKWSEHVVFLNILTWKCTSPQRGALFDISSSERAPMLLCFVRFYFDMFFAPQRRAIFHLSPRSSSSSSSSSNGRRKFGSQTSDNMER